MLNVTRGEGLLEVFLAKKRAEKANSLIPKEFRKGRILDIGCGTYPYFLISTDFKEKYGVDPSVNLSSIKDTNIKLLKLNMAKKKFPFNSNYFDIVTMLAVFEHIERNELRFLLDEIFRVLKKDGLLILTTPSPWSDRVLNIMARIRLISKEEMEEHKHHYDREAIKGIITEKHFKNKNFNSGFFEGYFNMWFTVKK